LRVPLDEPNIAHKTSVGIVSGFDSAPAVILRLRLTRVEGHVGSVLLIFNSGASPPTKIFAEVPGALALLEEDADLVSLPAIEFHTTPDSPALPSRS
jgi:hypothetical protein